MESREKENITKYERMKQSRKHDTEANTNKKDDDDDDVHDDEKEKKKKEQEGEQGGDEGDVCAWHCGHRLPHIAKTHI